MVEHRDASGGITPSLHLFSSSSFTLVDPPSTHIAFCVLQPHFDSQLLSRLISGVPQSLAHLYTTHPGSAVVVVVVSVVVVVVAVLDVSVAVFVVVAVSVVIDVYDVVVVPVSVVVDKEEVVDVMVVGSAVVVV